MGLTSFPEAIEAPLHSSLVEKRNGFQVALKRLIFFSVNHSRGKVPGFAFIRKICILGKKKK